MRQSSYISGTVPLSAVQFLYQRYIPVSAVQFLYQRYSSSISGTVPVSAVQFFYQRYSSCISGTVFLSAVQFFYQRYSSSISDTVPVSAVQFVYQPSHRRPDKPTDSLRIVGVSGEIRTGYIPSTPRQCAWCLETSMALVFVCS